MLLTSNTQLKLKSGKNTPTNLSRHLDVKKSPANRSRKSMYCSFTATFSPVSLSVAVWTWASEAAAIGL